MQYVILHSDSTEYKLFRIAIISRIPNTIVTPCPRVRIRAGRNRSPVVSVYTVP